MKRKGRVKLGTDQMLKTESEAESEDSKYRGRSMYKDREMAKTAREKWNKNQEEKGKGEE